MTDAATCLSVRKGTKSFAGSVALDSVDFEVKGGEIHALIGENGAGKSTLAKVMAGAVPLTSGSLLIDQQVCAFHSPADGLRAGVAMVYQETSLIPSLTVAQNILLGHEPWLNSFGTAERAARQALKSLDFDVEPTALVQDIGPAERQMVEIARAVHLNARVLIFDEPTASLSPAERDKFFNLLEALRRRGKAVVFITHALEEALTISDRITVLRDGRRVVCGPAQSFDRQLLVQLMVGRDLDERSTELGHCGVGGLELLAVDSVGSGVDGPRISLSLKSGEVVGLAGLVGAGRSDLAKFIAGLSRPQNDCNWSIRLRGEAVTFNTPRDAIAAGIVYVTEDRKLDGLFETMTTDDNIYLAAQARRRGWLRIYSRAIRKRLADYWRARLAIRTLHGDAVVSVYSGGNQQKVVIAKALAQDPEVIIFDEPTRGVDVGAIPQIHDVIREVAEDGKAVLVISSYLPEILRLSDRVLVMRDGRITASFDRADASEDLIMHAAVH
ncbi:MULTISPECIES: sugar ABC transporter ATP-binding protein [Filomicrobium]|uniref:Ribose import ATP-binding protein RbsA 2 n=2 Tax=Filomicrobium TaxID=119044 RepID=A0A0D6JJ83_9HYPH|nr:MULTISPECIES: sugar ABC transporter ATP-binding protein [Filomicrobium]MCV0370862.1 sugar ABC transporter ATP-binding protein [Filomicrobium sp.]CPR21981.1 Ribose import ATP-binding protein RbsA 2 [Candidatus Filomicrobium marinum]SDP47104.1 simple sugar transport system ATP-binding protein [Filomicrobium insigne]